MLKHFHQYKYCWWEILFSIYLLLWDIAVLLQETMASVWIWIYMGFSLTLGNADASELQCKFSNIQSPVDGHACEPPEYTNISTSERHHCSLACVHSGTCKATIFYQRNLVCMILLHPCILLKPYADHVYQAFEYPCTKWINASNAVDAYSIYETLNVQAYVARAFVGNDVMLGKFTHMFYAISPSGTKIRGGSNQEKIVIDASCNVTWVSYDATTGQPMPSGALIGGFLAATNTPLYVSRQAQSRCDWALGYYNPLNQKAWGECYGVQSNYIFEVMVVQPRDIINWDCISGWFVRNAYFLLNGINASLSYWRTLTIPIQLTSLTNTGVPCGLSLNIKRNIF